MKWISVVLVAISLALTGCASSESAKREADAAQRAADAEEAEAERAASPTCSVDCEDGESYAEISGGASREEYVTVTIGGKEYTMTRAQADAFLQRYREGAGERLAERRQEDLEDRVDELETQQLEARRDRNSNLDAGELRESCF